LKFKAEAESIISKCQPRIIVSDADKAVEKLFRKFHSVLLEIGRRHNARPSLQVNDEYDVQDLFRGLLRIYFEDIRDEEYTPSYAGASARMDLLLKNEQMVIETKMTRNGLGQKQVREQLIIDKAYYKIHKDCKKLYCLIYDPMYKIKNPRGFETDLSDMVNGFETKVFVIPERA